MSRSRVLEERRSFLGYDQRSQKTVQELKTLLAPAIDDLLDEFYQFMRERPETRGLLPTQETLARARNAQKQHWLLLLFSDELGDAYRKRAIQVGRAHERIGLTLSAYLGGYCYVLNRFADLVTAKYHDDAQALSDKLKSLHKAAFLDIDFVIESYLDAKNSAIRKILQNSTGFIGEIEKIDAELAELGEGLEAMCQALKENLKNSREQLDHLGNLLPPGDENLKLNEQMELALKAFAASEEKAQAVAEQFKLLSERLKQLNGEVEARKSKPRLTADSARQPGFLSRLKLAAQVLFPRN